MLLLSWVVVVRVFDLTVRWGIRYCALCFAITDVLELSGRV